MDMIGEFAARLFGTATDHRVGAKKLAVDSSDTRRLNLLGRTQTPCAALNFRGSQQFYKVVKYLRLGLESLVFVFPAEAGI